MYSIKQDNDFKFKKKLIVTVEIAVLLTVVTLIVFVMTGNVPLKGNGSADKHVEHTDNSIVYKDALTFETTAGYKYTEADEDNRENETHNNLHINNGDFNFQNNAAVTDSELSEPGVLKDPSGWSVAQIVAKAKDAVNKTKSYKNKLTVAHTEGFTADVTKCTGGGIVKSVVNLMIGWVVKPVDETLVYQNGRAINSEGENVPIILPKRNDFTLTESGVESASVKRSGNEYVINIKLVEESVGMHQVPQHNAAAVGYLDVANFDLSFMEIDSADIVYKGSSIELRINAAGYVTKAIYKIPLHIDGAAHKGSISGSASFEGEQTETWSLNY